MTVDELLNKLNAAFPAFNARALEAWGAAFREALGKHEGPALKAAYTAVLLSFTPKASKALHPMVADFLPHLPNLRLRLLQGGKDKPIDVQSHGERTRRILAEWRLAQGHRGANGITEVLHALEFIAEPLASLKAWKDDAEPLRLTGSELKLARHRAISQERRRKYGPPPRTNDEWWEQIQDVATGWNIPTAFDEWGRGKKSEAAA